MALLGLRSPNIGLPQEIFLEVARECCWEMWLVSARFEMVRFRRCNGPRIISGPVFRAAMQRAAPEVRSGVRIHSGAWYNVVQVQLMGLFCARGPITALAASTCEQALLEPGFKLRILEKRIPQQASGSQSFPTWFSLGASYFLHK